MRKKVGLLVVHGIGEQEAGATVQNFMEGVEMAYGAENVSVEETGGEKGSNRRPVTRRVRIEDVDTDVYIYEVHWADVLADAAESFDIEALVALNWMPKFNRQSGLYVRSPPKKRGIFSIPMVLGFVSASMWFAYQAAMFAFSIGGMLLHLGLYVLYIPLFFVGKLLQKLMRVPLTEKSAGYLHGKIQPFARRILDSTRPVHEKNSRYRKAGFQHWLDHKLNHYLGDIFTYTHSMGGTFDLPEKRKDAARRVLNIFYDRIDAVMRDCDEFHVLAHSLGTVIAFHGLTGYGLERGVPGVEQSVRPLGKLKGLFTIGSPINKFRYFWPVLATGEASGQLVKNERWSRSSLYVNDPEFEWHNFWNPLDPVAGRLEDIDGWPSVENHVIWQGGLISSHVIYERNAYFLSVLGERVFGRVPGLKISAWSKFLGISKGFFESIGALGFFALLTVSGVGLFASVLFAVAGLVGAGVGFVWGEAFGIQIRIWAFFGLLALLIFGSYFLGIDRARTDVDAWRNARQRNPPD